MEITLNKPYGVTFSAEVITVVDEHGNEVGAWVNKRAFWTITPRTVAELDALCELIEMGDAAEFEGVEFEDAEFDGSVGSHSDLNDGYDYDDLHEGECDGTTYYGIHSIEEIE